MFDEQPKVVDMFDGEGAAPKPQPPAAPVSPLLTPPPPKPSASLAPAVPAAPEASRFHVLKAALIFAAILALIGGAGYAAWRMMAQEPSSEGPVRSVSNDGIVAPGEEAEEQAQEEPAAEEQSASTDSPIEQPAARTSLIDSDGDGLTNAEELEAGTKVNEADTDSDGLGDREEVEVYGTNPRKEDTDGDTFLDGQEVAAGYNPNGEGRLFNVPNP